MRMNNGWSPRGGIPGLWVYPTPSARRKRLHKLLKHIVRPVDDAEIEANALDTNMSGGIDNPVSRNGYLWQEGVDEFLCRDRRERDVAESFSGSRTK